MRVSSDLESVPFDQLLVGGRSVGSVGDFWGGRVGPGHDDGQIPLCSGLQGPTGCSRAHD